MQAGLLRDRVTHRTATTVDDGQGGQTVTWVDGATFWASVVPVTNAERRIAGAMQIASSHVVSMRYRTGMSPTDRLYVTPDGPTLEILGVRNEDAQRIELTLDCAEVL